MARVAVFFRWLLLFMLVSVPGVLLALGLGRPKQAWVGPLFAFAAILVSGLICERRLARAHGAGPETRGSFLDRSLLRALEGTGLRPPRLRVFPDPSPNALVLRPLFGEPFVYLSEGLLSLLNEAELRAVFRACASAAGGAGLSLRTLCAWWAVGSVRWMPARWTRTVWRGAPAESGSLTVGSFLGFLALYPVVRGLHRLGGSIHAANEADLDLSAALQKLDRAVSSWDLSQSPGAVALYLRRPWAQNSVVSL
jgi:hypothetical protein